MFNLGIGEILVILGIALVFIGPKQLPEVARTIARLLNEWRGVTSDLSRSLLETRRDVESSVRRQMDDVEKAIEVEKNVPKTEAPSISKEVESSSVEPKTGVNDSDDGTQEAKEDGQK